MGTGWRLPKEKTETDKLIRARQGPVPISGSVTQLRLFAQGMDVTYIGQDIYDGLRCQMPAYHAYPSSAPNTPEPKPLPNGLRLSVIVRRVMYLTFL